jgi:hypothetical protein
MKNFNKKLCFLTLLAVMILSFISTTNNYAQEEREDNPRTWKYFRILARAQDDSIFIILQDDLLIDPKLESYTFTVNILDLQPINQYVVIGDEYSPDALRYAWDQLSERVQEGLINWVGSNKENLNKKKLNYGSVFLDVFKKIKIKELVAPPSKVREIKNTTAYINPYLQIFGGEPVGIPLKRSFGFSFSTGTPYSGPLESELVSGYFNLLGAAIGINTRIKELTRRRASRSPEDKSESSFAFKDYNNIFGPNLGIEVKYVIPFGNFFEFGIYSVLDSGSYDPPIPIVNEETLPDTTYMPNLVIDGTYFNWEFRYPFRTFGSTRAKIYVARYLNEWHVGWTAREMRIAGAIFDARLNFMVKGEKRNFQVLYETLISDIGEGFSNTAFAFGPSIRLGKMASGSFGVLTVMMNIRFKIGDFFDER